MTRKPIHAGSAFLGLLLVLGALYAGCQNPSSQVAPQSAPAEGTSAITGSPNDHLIIMTWNIRGYPESTPEYTAWLHKQVADAKADVLCVQEIANQSKVNAFMADDARLKHGAFRESPDGQDNAIFGDDRVGLKDSPDPEGFQHPAQAAYIWYKGFDAVLITVHLSWTNEAKREQEKALLKKVVESALKIDPDVIVCGDFNTTEADIRVLAASLGLTVLASPGQEGVGTTHAGNRYDWFLVSPDLASEEAETCRVITFAGDDLAIARKVSDHMPVVAAFRTDATFRDRKPAESERDSTDPVAWRSHHEADCCLPEEPQLYCEGHPPVSSATGRALPGHPDLAESH